MQQTQNVKAIFFDIDGTLLSGETKIIPQSAIDALWRAHDRGYLLFISTGRHPAEIKQVPRLMELPFSGVVAMNGQYCFAGDTLVHTDTLPQEDVKSLVSYLETAPYAGLYSRSEGMYITKFTPAVQEVCDSIGTKPAPIGSFEHMLSAPIFQAGLFLGGDEVPQVLNNLSGSYWTRWHLSGVDISPKTGGKWAGVTRMAQHFGVDPREIMAVGDNENDIDMLQSAGYSVAMGNGTPNAKKAAHHITATVDDNGIALALEQLPRMA